MNECEISAGKRFEVEAYYDKEEFDTEFIENDILTAMRKAYGLLSDNLSNANLSDEYFPLDRVEIYGYEDNILVGRNVEMWAKPENKFAERRIVFAEVVKDAGIQFCKENNGEMVGENECRIVFQW